MQCVPSPGEDAQEFQDSPYFLYQFSDMSSSVRPDDASK
eukprot:gene4243-4542_t